MGMGFLCASLLIASSFPSYGQSQNTVSSVRLTLKPGFWESVTILQQE